MKNETRKNILAAIDEAIGYAEALECVPAKHALNHIKSLMSLEGSFVEGTPSIFDTKLTSLVFDYMGLFDDVHYWAELKCVRNEYYTAGTVMQKLSEKIHAATIEGEASND